MLCTLTGCLVGPKYQTPARYHGDSTGRLQRKPDTIQGRPGLESGATSGRDAARALVEDIQRSGVECSGRATQHQQSEHQTILPKLHGSACPGGRSESSTLSDSDRERFLHAIRRRLCHTDDRDPIGFRCLMGAGSLGKGPQRRAVGSIQCPAQRCRSGERAINRTGRVWPPFSSRSADRMR